MPWCLWDRREDVESGLWDVTLPPHPGRGSCVTGERLAFAGRRSLRVTAGSSELSHRVQGVQQPADVPLVGTSCQVSPPGGPGSPAGAHFLQGGYPLWRERLAIFGGLLLQRFSSGNLTHAQAPSPHGPSSTPGSLSPSGSLEPTACGARPDAHQLHVTRRHK